MPLVVAGLLMVVDDHVAQGHRHMAEKARKEDVPLSEFIGMLETEPACTREGHCRVLEWNTGNAPSALLHNLKHNKVLHEQNVILHVLTEDTPRVDEAERSRSSVFRITSCA